MKIEPKTDAQFKKAEATMRLAAVIDQAMHQARHNAPVRPELIHELQAILGLLSGE